MSSRPDPATETEVVGPGGSRPGGLDADIIDAAADADAVEGDAVEGEVVEGALVEDGAVKADDDAVAGVVEPEVFDDGGTVVADAASLAAERDDYLRALQQVQADFENYRKRVLRQQDEQSARAALGLVGTLLPVLDTLDLAEAHLAAPGAVATDEGKALGQARAMLIDVLSKEGLERVDQAGVTFDPVVHDAVAHAPAPDDGDGDGPGETVVDEVLRSGYRWRGQVLRPAMVRVQG